jgi:hypothetical protein
MSNTLTDNQMKQLAKLGKAIQDALECNVNGEGVPCRTDRLDAVQSMIKYLQIHNYSVNHWR